MGAEGRHPTIGRGVFETHKFFSTATSVSDEIELADVP
jgi:hypothetical protein